MGITPVPRIVAVLTLTPGSRLMTGAGEAAALRRKNVGTGVDDSLICVTGAGIHEATTNRASRVPSRMLCVMNCQPSPMPRKFPSYRGVSTYLSRSTAEPSTRDARRLALPTWSRTG